MTRTRPHRDPHAAPQLRECDPRHIRRLRASFPRFANGAALAGFCRSVALAFSCAAGLLPSAAHGADQSTTPPAASTERPALPPLPEHKGIRRMPLDQSSPHRWTPIRDGVRLESTGARGAELLRVSYRRTRQTAAGVAFVLPDGSLRDAGELRLRIRCEPAQRLNVCLTDAAGAVWTFPALRADGESAERTFKLSELVPDRWQNGGRTLPDRPDLRSIRLLTILDISGHMGGAETDCTWTIELAEIAATTTDGNSHRSNGAPSTTGAEEGVDAVSAAGPSSTPHPVGTDRPSLVDALRAGPAARDAAITALSAAVVSSATATTGVVDGELLLHLGLAHLWSADDSDVPTARRRVDLEQAERALKQAMSALPDDDRISSWHANAAFELAKLRGDAIAAARHMETLCRNALAEPCFHSIPLAIAAWSELTGSGARTASLVACREAMACGHRGDRAAMNARSWPFNVQGFLAAFGDLALAEGDPDAAEEAWELALSRPDSESWPFRHEVAHRLETLGQRAASFADTDAANDPAFILGRRPGGSCVVCHQAR